MRDPNPGVALVTRPSPIRNAQWRSSAARDSYAAPHGAAS
jgi:hypothetical protein